MKILKVFALRDTMTPSQVRTIMVQHSVQLFASARTKVCTTSSHAIVVIRRGVLSIASKERAQVLEQELVPLGPLAAL